MSVMPICLVYVANSALLNTHLMRDYTVFMPHKRHTTHTFVCVSSCTTIGGVGSGRIRTDLRASQSWQHTHTHTHTQHRQPYRLIIGFDYVVKMSSAIRRYPIALQVEHHIKPVAVPPAVLGSNIFARPAADPPISPTNAYCYLAQVRGGGCLRRHRRALPMNGLLFVDIAENRRTKYAGKCVENRQTRTHTHSAIY